MEDNNEPTPSRPVTPAIGRSSVPATVRGPVFDNRTHRAFSYRRVGKKWGWLRWAGLGYINSEPSPEEIAAIFKGQPVDANIVRRILGFAVAHIFVEMRPETGGTGYFRMVPKEIKPPRRITEPDDPREDDPDETDETWPER